MDIHLDSHWVDFKIVDMHLHFPIKQDDWLKPWREKYVQRNGLGRWEELQSLKSTIPSWLPEFSFPEPEEPSSDITVTAQRWAKECQKYNLERVVFMTGGNNQILSDVVKANSAYFAGFAHHSIEEEAAATTLEKAITDQGLCGYKIMAPLVDRPLCSPDFDPVFEVCHQYSLPVLVHFGILGGAGGIVSGPNMSPLSIAQTANRFPKIKFIVPHFGCGYTNDLLQLCWAAPNVYVDTSGNNLWTKWTMESYSLEQLFQKFYSTIGPGRILFGSDSEWFPRGFAVRYLWDQLRAVQYLNLPKADIRRIFRENALEVLQL